MYIAMFPLLHLCSVCNDVFLAQLLRGQFTAGLHCSWAWSMELCQPCNMRGHCSQSSCNYQHNPFTRLSLQTFSCRGWGHMRSCPSPKTFTWLATEGASILWWHNHLPRLPLRPVPGSNPNQIHCFTKLDLGRSVSLACCWCCFCGKDICLPLPQEKVNVIPSSQDGYCSTR